MDMREIRRRFRDLIERPQGELHLAEGALLIAQEAYPHLDINVYLQRLAALSNTIKQRLGMELDPRRIVAAINVHLYDELNFRGNQDHYYDPRNSFLNEVLERKIGIPITLSVIYIEIGRQVGLPIMGVGLPGHFIVQYAARSDTFWIDPFYGGTILTPADCAARIQQIYGHNVEWHDTFLTPVSDHDILRRMLGNLKGIYIQQRDYRRALNVVERLLLMTPDQPAEVRDYGLLHHQLGNLEAAIDHLERYLQLAAEASDAATITQYLAALRRQLDA